MADEATPVFQIQRMYLKDLSLEQPNSPQILLEQQQPQVDINLGVGAEQVADGIYEVTVTATVTTKVQDKVLFLVEAKQAGIFEIRDVPQDQMQGIIGIVCPQMIYPYLRAIVSVLGRRQPPVERHEQRAQPCAGKEQGEHFRAVEAEEGDALAASDTSRGQRRGKPVDLLRQLRAGNLATRKANGRLVGRQPGVARYPVAYAHVAMRRRRLRGPRPSPYRPRRSR